jgi:hypothetical protein
MDDFSVLTGLLGYLDSTQEVELKSLHAQTWTFRKSVGLKKAFGGIFSRPLFTIIFRPKILILDTYSILNT